MATFFRTVGIWKISAAFTKSIIRYYNRDIIEERLSLPIITTPIRLQKKARKFRERKLREAQQFHDLYGVDRDRDFRIIRCADKTVDHYAGQRYPRNRPVPLRSSFWKKTKYAGETLTVYQRAGFNSVFFDKQKLSFENLPLNDKILDVLEQNGYVRPTNIQWFAIPKLLENSNAIIAAETGSGKTLAYLLPLLDKLQKFRETHGPPTPGSPRAVIFAPTQELTTQIFENVKIFAANSELNVALFNSAEVYPKSLEEPRDIIVTTPGRLNRFKNVQAVDFQSLNSVIIDEADTLLDDTFRDLMLNLLRDVSFRIDAGDESIQLILTSATFPNRLDEFLAGLACVERFERITTENLHVLQPHVKHQFIRLTNRMVVERLLILVKNEIKNHRNCLIFVRNVDTGMFVYDMLRNNYVECEFLFRNEKRRLDDCDKILRDFKCEKIKVLIATDLGSRGLDFVNVQHVINFSFPKTLADYLHRAGRLGRLGSKAGGGLVTSFVLDRGFVRMVELIEKSVRLDQPLTNVAINVKQEYYEQRHSASSEEETSTE